MKNLKRTLPFFGLILLAVSCRKNDYKAEMPTVIAEPAAAAAPWTSITNWSSSKVENTTVYFAKLSDTSITADVAKTGLVLVYKKQGSTVQSLPAQDGNVSWHYQVSSGAIRINSENSDGQDLSQPSFSYFVITPEKLSKLEAAGKTKFELLDLEFEQALTLLN